MSARRYNPGHDEKESAIRLLIGNLPALSAAPNKWAVLDRREVNLRWLTGAFLTALVGTALIGGALYVALERSASLVRTPWVAKVAESVSGGGLVVSSELKSNKLALTPVEAASKKTISISNSVQLGDQEVVVVRPFTFVSTGMSLTRSENTASLQPFNPNTILEPTATDVDAEAPTEEISIDELTEFEGELKLSFRVMSDVYFAPGSADELPEEKIQQLARASVADNQNAILNFGANFGLNMFSGKSAGDQLTLADASPQQDFEANVDLFNVKLTPENVTTISKTRSKVGVPSKADTKTIALKEGDRLFDVLSLAGVRSREAALLVSALTSSVKDLKFEEGRALRVDFVSPAEHSGVVRPNQPFRVRLMHGTETVGGVMLADNGEYVPLAHPSTIIDNDAELAELIDLDKTPSIYRSLFETAIKQKIPENIASKLISIFSQDVDFTQQVRPGNSFEVLYEDLVNSENDQANPDILYASLNVGGQERRYYRFRTTDDNVYDFYDPKGRTAKLFLLTKPVKTGVLRSKFGNRKHPILGYVRLHSGIDWAAPRGTPIYAAGNGVILSAKYSSGYGRYISIQHSNGYQTAYAHLQSFAKGIEPGKRVYQGEVIGYVGSTGLSTGPHLHFEVKINGNFVDPLRIKVPRGRVLTGQQLEAFNKQRALIDNLIQNSQSRELSQIIN